MWNAMSMVETSEAQLEGAISATAIAAAAIAKPSPPKTLQFGIRPSLCSSLSNILYYINIIFCPSLGNSIATVYNSLHFLLTPSSPPSGYILAITDADYRCHGWWYDSMRTGP